MVMKKYVIASIMILILWAVPCSFGQDYVVGEGDVLKIMVYEHNDLATTARVSGDGKVGFPLLGQVEVTNRSVSQISEKLQRLLADGYIVDPQVAVFIEEYRSKNVTILGQVKSPGLYELRGPITFLELISKAGGLTKDVGSTGTIKRKSRSEKDAITIKVDIKRLVENGETSLNIPIENEDSVYITKADVFYVTGQVKKPNVYRHGLETTIIKAITMAGGFTGKASPRNVKIIRKLNGKEEVFTKVKMDEIVLADDVIVVPESFF